MVSIAGTCFAAGNEVIYVSTTGDDMYNGQAAEYDPITGDGPKATIQNGIDTADDNGTVFVASGTYKENLLVNKNLILIGEDLDSTIIDGQQKSTVISFYGQNMVPEKFTFILSGFTITNGKFTYGGGLYLYGGTAALANLLVTNNQATGDGHNGGGVYAAFGKVYADINSVSITGNYHLSYKNEKIPDEVQGNITYVDLNEKLLQGQNLFGSTTVREGAPKLLEDLLVSHESTPEDNQVTAANTVTMQPTGFPLNYLVLGVFMVFGGLILPRRK